MTRQITNTALIALAFALTLSASASAALIAHYKLDETLAGPVVNEVGTDGTNNGATINQTGQVMQAYDFSGADGVYANIANPLVGTGPFSLAAWINPDSLAAAQPTWGMGIVKSTVNAGAIGDFMLSVDDGGSLHFSNWRTTGADATGVNFSADGVISTSQWTHVAGTWDGSVNRIYVNGSEVLISGTENSGSGWLTESTIGRLFPGGGGAYHFDGRIDDVGIWNETLDSDQIGIIYANGLNGLDLAFVAPPVPEPSCALLLALGMIPVARRARRRNRNSAQ